jgi:hypothetical protein
MQINIKSFQFIELIKMQADASIALPLNTANFYKNTYIRRVKRVHGSGEYTYTSDLKNMKKEEV